MKVGDRDNLYHLSNDDINTTSFDPVNHISTKQNTLTKDISPNIINLSNIENLKILDSKLFPLFTQSCCDHISQELLRYHKLTGNSLGPTLSQAKTRLPFTYQALSHPRITSILSSMAGFELEICFEKFEISQFATIHNLKENYSNLSNWRKIPYTFICLIQLDQELNSELNGLPLGMATILEGKLLNNLLSLQFTQKSTFHSSAFKLNLMIVLKPSNIIDFENQRVLLKLGSQSLLKITYHNNENDLDPTEDIQKYATWLDLHYEKLLSN